MEASDGKKIYINCWDRVENPKIVVQIFHGMKEHSSRYDEFAKYLNSKNILVYADDHRGHGHTAIPKEEYGHLEKDGVDRIVKDEHELNKYIMKKHKGIEKNIIFGHSFGSFIAQRYIVSYGKELSGLILSGSAAMKGMEVRAGSIFTNVLKMIYGDTKRSSFLNKLMFINYNSRVKDSMSKNAWLSSDKKEVDKYEKDELCGGDFTVGFFKTFLGGLSKLYRKSELEKIPKQLPIYIVSGEEDPVGNYGKSVRNLYNIYSEIGIKKTEMKLYKNARHELTNEVVRCELFADLVKWIEKL